MVAKFGARLLMVTGATGGRSYAHALATGYLPAMIVMGARCVAAAPVTALFVSDARAGAHRCVPRSPQAGCAVPVPAKTVEVVAS